MAGCGSASGLCRRLVSSLIQENLCILHCFISELAERSSEYNSGVSSIESAVYAIKWATQWLVSRLVVLAIPLSKVCFRRCQKNACVPTSA